MRDATSRPMSLAHRLALGLVWLTIASGAVVFTEPAPFDVLALGLLILLPVLGLVRITPGMIVYISISLIPVGCAFLAILAAMDPSRSIVHTAVTLFLMCVSILLTAFVAKSPQRHATLILNGTVAAAVLAASCGLAGYTGAFAGAYDIFTLYGRVSGTFKDPNVFGASLVLPSTYLMHVLLSQRSWKVKAPALCALMLLVLCILLSFSRGAWFGLAVSTAILAYVSIVTARSAAQRMKLLTGLGGAAVIGAVLLGIALQFDAVSSLLSERASLTQSYDEGPEGRFGGQVKARALILSHPFGLGAQQFDGFYHLEEAHNVYLSMFMNAGWLGGGIFALLVAGTVAFGARHALRRSPTQGLYVVVFAAFVAHAFEGYVIDLDHWRHFHLLMALNWGLMLADGEPVRAAKRRIARILRPASMRAAYMAS